MNALPERLIVDPQQLSVVNGHRQEGRQWRFDQIGGFRVEPSIGSCSSKPAWTSGGSMFCAGRGASIRGCASWRIGWRCDAARAIGRARRPGGGYAGKAPPDGVRRRQPRARTIATSAGNRADSFPAPPLSRQRDAAAGIVPGGGGHRRGSAHFAEAAGRPCPPDQPAQKLPGAVALPFAGDHCRPVAGPAGRHAGHRLEGHRRQPRRHHAHRQFAQRPGPEAERTALGVSRPQPGRHPHESGGLRHGKPAHAGLPHDERFPSPILSIGGHRRDALLLEREVGPHHLAAHALDPCRQLVFHPLSPAAPSPLLGSGGQTGLGPGGNARGDSRRQGLCAGGPRGAAVLRVEPAAARFAA